jgi:nitroreductase
MDSSVGTGAESHAATTTAPLHSLLALRWSTRAFDPEHVLNDRQVTALLEAARWSPSASNTQTWRFLVAHRGTLEHATVLDTLAPGNAAWADSASALVVVAATSHDPAGRPLPWSAYDTGQSIAHLSVQAQHEGLTVHQLGGFDANRLKSALDGEDGVTPLVVVAIGQHDPTVILPEPFASREYAPRERRSVDDLVMTLRSTAVVAATVPTTSQNSS